MKALKKEIDTILSNKLHDAVKAYQAQRDADIEELAGLKEAMKAIETEKAGIMEAMKKLNVRKTRDLGEHNRLDGKLRWLDRQIKGKRTQIDALMKKLTDIQVDPQTLTLLLAYQEREGGKNETG